MNLTDGVGGCHVDGSVNGSVTADPDSQSALSISEEGNIDGWEFAIQHFFGDSGFGVAGSYTKVDGDVEADPGQDPGQLLGVGLVIPLATTGLRVVGRAGQLLDRSHQGVTRCTDHIRVITLDNLLEGLDLDALLAQLPAASGRGHRSALSTQPPLAAEAPVQFRHGTPRGDQRPRRELLQLRLHPPPGQAQVLHLTLQDEPLGVHPVLDLGLHRPAGTQLEAQAGVGALADGAPVDLHCPHGDVGQAEARFEDQDRQQDDRQGPVVHQRMEPAHQRVQGLGDEGEHAVVHRDVPRLGIVRQLAAIKRTHVRSRLNITGE